MMTRRQAREWIVQVLFELDFNPRPLDVLLKDFWAGRETDEVSRQFVTDRVSGIQQKLPEIDGILRRYAEHWDLERMAGTDRNVMRLAMYEMLYCYDVPPVVAINEAVDIAKYFNNKESGRFVNGILDRARKDLDRPAREAGGPRRAKRDGE